MPIFICLSFMLLPQLENHDSSTNHTIVSIKLHMSIMNLVTFCNFKDLYGMYVAQLFSVSVSHCLKEFLVPHADPANTYVYYTFPPSCIFVSFMLSISFYAFSQHFSRYATLKICMVCVCSSAFLSLCFSLF